MPVSLFTPRLSLPLGTLACLAVLLACDGGLRGTPVDEPRDDGLDCVCTLPSGTCEDEFVDSGVDRDGIPALRDPNLTAAEPAHLDQGGYLADNSRVIGLLVAGRPLAVPHNILRHHEIANLTFKGKNLAITYCPLTGSALAFDRSTVDGAEFVVSGLLLKNNLVMIEESANESLRSQMNREANCGPKAGASLMQWPVVDIQWGQWTALYPDTKVIAEDTGFDFNYHPSANPYEGYERPTNDHLFVPMPIDERRPPKERVLGLPRQNGASPIFSRNSPRRLSGYSPPPSGVSPSSSSGTARPGRPWPTPPLSTVGVYRSRCATRPSSTRRSRAPGR